MGQSERILNESRKKGFTLKGGVGSQKGGGTNVVLTSQMFLALKRKKRKNTCVITIVGISANPLRTKQGKKKKGGGKKRGML